MTDASVETQLRGPCPDWCEREHHPTDHPDDHVHYGPSVELPVRRRSRTMGENEEDWKSDTSVMSIALAQRAGERAVWVLADLGEGRTVALSAESARLLHQSLVDLMETTG